MSTDLLEIVNLTIIHYIKYNHFKVVYLYYNKVSSFYIKIKIYKFFTAVNLLY